MPAFERPQPIESACYCPTTGWSRAPSSYACQHDADIVSSGTKVFDADGRTEFVEVGSTPRMRNFLQCNTLERKARYLQHFFLFRKSKLEEIGGADESLGDFPGIDDFDMIWVLLEQSATVAIVEQQLYNYRDHSGDRLTLRPSEQATAVLEKNS